MFPDLTNEDPANRDLLEKLTLPLTGWTVRLHQRKGDPARLVVDPGGGSPMAHLLLAQSAPRQLLLGAHHVRLARPFGPSAISTVTLAYGVAGDVPPRLAFRRRRSWRTARVRNVRPMLLAGRVWVAEEAGHFDEIQATASGSTTARLV
ncbi:hypothetical protein [Actinomadura verrucosospora]|uniref:Uncharacterized protein n=1 Tax=Actinomadura verrucosospora TaxID=46165 RepID=A0A7D3VRL8_ACTVE|nr:hypothetical protein [Actinomadura verrucosospora]QKG20770.1 hypothetical protein ACTIVE_2408 [Actinomadura verrucosospora]